jgi:hypothetical protein
MSASGHAGPRVGAILVAIIVALVAGGCAASGSVTPLSTDGAGPAASTDPDAPTPVPNTVPTPLEPGSGGVVLTAANIAFGQTEVAAPADTPFQLQLDNKDGGVPHNVTILAADGSEVFSGDIFVGPGLRVYDVPALPAGSYRFMCKVHPNMTGTLHVGG